MLGSSLVSSRSSNSLSFNDFHYYNVNHSPSSPLSFCSPSPILSLLSFHDSQVQRRSLLSFVPPSLPPSLPPHLSLFSPPLTSSHLLSPLTSFLFPLSSLLSPLSSLLSPLSSLLCSPLLCSPLLSLPSPPSSQESM